MRNLTDTLRMAWIIGTKDILDALKNKNSLVNILVMLLMVAFFYWLGVVRPFDQDVSVVVYAEAPSSFAFNRTSLGSGAVYTFQQASSFQDMETRLAFQDLGLVLPASLDQTLASGGLVDLSGYIFWANRMKVAGLEAKYSQAFSEILDRPVRIVIDRNILVPPAGSHGMPTTVASQMVYFIFFTALSLIPSLMLEEKQARTLEALLVSPASPGQVILGKSLAGFFYILIIGGLALGLYGAYIVNWALAAVALLGYALLATGLGLAVGSFIKSMKQLGLWMVLLILVLEIPPLFYMEPNLKDGVRTILTWFPTSALASLFSFSCSTGVRAEPFLLNLAVAGMSVAIVFALVIWKVRRSDR